MKKILVILGIFLLLFATASYLSFLEVRRQEKTRQKTHKQQMVDQVDISKIAKSDLDLWVNGTGPYTRGYKVRKGEEMKIKLTVQNANIEKEVSELIFDGGLLEIRVEGANNHEKLDVSFDPKTTWKGLTAQYMANNTGEDRVVAKIEGTDVVFETNIVVLDYSFFVKPIDLASDDVTFDQTKILSLDSSEVIQEGEDVFGSPDPHDDIPGRIKINLKSESEKFEYAFLEIYAVSNESIEKYDADDPLTSFKYLGNLSELNGYIENKPAIPTGITLQRFPRVNASAGPVGNVGFVDFEDGTGLRYTVAGYYQAYDPSKYPFYFYQGITDDGKYHVLFKYSRLFSPKLNAYYEDPGPASMQSDEYDEYVQGSFEELSKERDFSPSLKELDDFVRSIRIK